MNRTVVHPAGPLRGRARVPGDKSISHRALLLGALAEGESRIEGPLLTGDGQATLHCLQALGVETALSVKDDSTPVLTVVGRGLRGFREPAVPLDCVRSATTMRLLAGVLSGQPFSSVLTGDPQLLRRPMRRVVEPLRRMGADITDTDGHAPLTIRGRPLQGCEHRLEVASAQVKSALLLAGLLADGPTVVQEPAPTRDHTERMLAAMGVDVRKEGEGIILHPPAQSLRPLSPTVPGDFSSAAFLIVASVLVPDSEVTICDVGLNPTRTGLLDVLRAMGASITVTDEHLLGGEPVGNITVRSSALWGTEVSGDLVVRMIDEFPILAVAATQARGRTVVRDAAELRVKETDRIATVVEELGKMGARIEPLPDGFVVAGPTPLRGAPVSSHGDHRLAMALFVAGLVASGPTVVENMECAADSFPDFVPTMERLMGGPR